MISTIRRHPGERGLIAYALGDSDHAERARIARHLLSCERCHASARALASLADASKALPLDAPSDQLLERVLADRQRGARVVLPTGETTQEGTRSRVLMIGAALAAGLLLAVVLGGRSDARPDSPAVALFTPADLYAAEGSPGVQSPTPLDPQRIAALQPGVWKYSAVIRPRRTGEFVPQYEETFALERPDASTIRWVAGIPRREIQAYVDTTMLDAATLVMERHATYRFGALWSDERFTPRTLSRTYPFREAGGPLEFRMKEFTIPGEMAGRSFLIAPQSTLPLLLRTVRMQQGAAIRIPNLSQRFLADGSLVAEGRTITLVVTGSERIRVPAGAFDCWVVETRGGDVRAFERFWLERGSQLLVRRETVFRGRAFRREELQVASR